MNIKKYNFHLILIPSIFLFITCSKETKKDPLLVEAFQIHEKSMSLAKDVKEMLDVMSENDSVIMNIEQRFNNWEEMVIEVPGFEHNHDHDHDHDHHHHHEQELNLTPQQIFDIQVELKDSITAIKEEVMLYKQSVEM